jgi:hypothetical protein
MLNSALVPTARTLPPRLPPCPPATVVTAPVAVAMRRTMLLVSSATYRLLPEASSESHDGE